MRRGVAQERNTRIYLELKYLHICSELELLRCSIITIITEKKRYRYVGVHTEQMARGGQLNVGGIYLTTIRMREVEVVK